MLCPIQALLAAAAIMVSISAKFLLLRKNPKLFFRKTLGAIGRYALRNLIALIALGISILAYSNQRDQAEAHNHQSSRIDSLRYLTRGLEYQPILEVDSILSFEVYDYELLTPNDSIFPTPKIIPIDSQKVMLAFEESGVDSLKTDSVVNNLIRGTLKIRVSLLVTNTGNASAKLQSYSVKDTLWDGPRLRDIVLSELDSQNFRVKLFDEFFKREILPGQTTEIEFDYSVGHFERGKVITHALLLYENQIGNLYDTYLWLLYEDLPHVFLPEFRLERYNEGVIVHWRLNTVQKSQDISARIANQSFKMYNQREASRVAAYWDRLLRSLDALK